MCTVVRSLLLGYSSCFYFTYVGYLNFVCGGTGVVSVLNTELHCSFSFCNKNKTFKKKKATVSKIFQFSYPFLFVLSHVAYNMDNV